ncbi:ubiquitin-conjugating enzyme E2 U-like [Saccoglossus kowalevskii]|uniref:Ubiquitin-conjugating enzyme E2 U-like n=1 Tax=Saccoglossus kowalevskii TaxID=10224 RepID=A0ABM0GL75_SACKO|nr:PREDICTED: ubiquitin-conjugating enzyme E2 U-like [Saccoglossus kowalevskii]
MHCRAYMLLEKQYAQFQKEPPWGIEAFFTDDSNFFEWTIKIRGLKDTLWEGGIFTVHVKFTENYNAVPPSVYFHTIPFHPNIDMVTGKPCINFLDNIELWKETYSVEFILLAVQNLLSNPVLESPANDDAAHLFNTNASRYRELVLQCVAASQRYHSGWKPHEEKRPPKEEVKHTTQTATRRLFRISFDDYHTTWAGIATSKPKSEMKNPLLESIKDDPKLQTAHYGLPYNELQIQMRKQLEEHNSLMYGNFARKQSEKEMADKKMEQLNKMRRIYFQKKLEKPAPPPSSAQSEQGDHHPDEPWEKEVDDLVEWTNKLDEQEIQ